MSHLEIGLDTFGDRTIGADGKLQSHAQVIRNLVEQAELAVLDARRSLEGPRRSDPLPWSTGR